MTDEVLIACVCAVCRRPPSALASALSVLRLLSIGAMAAVAGACTAEALTLISPHRAPLADRLTRAPLLVHRGMAEVCKSIAAR